MRCLPNHIAALNILRPVYLQAFIDTYMKEYYTNFEDFKDCENLAYEEAYLMNIIFEVLDNSTADLEEEYSEEMEDEDDCPEYDAFYYVQLLDIKAYIATIEDLGGRVFGVLLRQLHTFYL